MILSAQTIRKVRPLTPLCERGTIRGRSFGLSSCGYDVRVSFTGLAENTFKFSQPEWTPTKALYGPVLKPVEGSGLTFMLAATMEHFDMPDDVVGFVHDKSSWARQGLAVQNTVIEPGWRGCLTLELTYHGNDELIICQGDPIAQIIFHRLDRPTDQPYDGKYQDQEAGPQEARFE